MKNYDTITFWKDWKPYLIYTFTFFLLLFPIMSDKITVCKVVSTPRVSVSIKYLLTNTSLFLLQQAFPPVPLLAKNSSCVEECVNKVSMFINLLLLNLCASSCQFVREVPPVNFLKTIPKPNFLSVSFPFVCQEDTRTNSVFI